VRSENDGARAVGFVTFVHTSRRREEVLKKGLSRVAPICFKRQARHIIVGLALAAALVLFVRFRLARSDRPELRDLITALANEPTRRVEGRLSGGFKYAPPPALPRGSGAREVSPDVTIAVANIEKLAKQRDTPINLAALGVAYMVSGQLDQAIDAISEAARRDESARFQNDLSAAYLARARWNHRAEDWVNALAAADRAIARDPLRSEFYFNRALALEGLHLTDQAMDAWTTHGALDPSPAWTAESAGRRRTLIEYQRQRQGLAVNGSQQDHQAIRERIEDRLLADWGRAVADFHPETAEPLLAEADVLAEALARSGGDAMPRDETRRIRRAQASADRRTVRELALGHWLYGDARRSFVADSQQKASEEMTQASRHFQRAHSLYSLWAPILRSVFLRNRGDAQSALDELRVLKVEAIPEDYHHLGGRLAWTDGVALDAMGRFDLGRQQLNRAVEEFRRAGEDDDLIATQTLLAEAEWFLGERASAWSDIVAVLKLVDARRDLRRNYHLWVAATMASTANLPEAALEFQNARVRQAGSPRSKTEAFIDRARTFSRLGNDAAAGDDLRRASEALMGLNDRALKERNQADVMIAQAEILSHVDARRAIEQANAALEYVPRADPAIRLASLLALRAKCKETLGDLGGARSDLLAAIEAFEQKRKLLLSGRDRMEAFEQERSTFKQLVRLEVERATDTDEALRVAERARAGVLLENWDDLSRGPVDPTRAHQDLGAGVAVIYYETLPDRVLIWVLTRERAVHVSRPLPLPALSAMIKRVQRDIENGADLEGLKPHSAELFRNILEPALSLVTHQTTLVFVPDGPLFAVPFAALPNRDGSPLVATFNVGIAPSLTAYLAASSRLSSLDFDTVLAIGDGHDPSGSGLPTLPMADAEAMAVGSLYPHSVVLTGGGATKRRILRERASVVHFAGHTVVNLQYPMLSRLLLAPDAEQHDPGGLFMSEITRERFGSARVVVLATCDGAVGRFIQGEGVTSVARAFFAAGVPAVVASLWPAEDSAGDLLMAFHRELRTRHDVTVALRASQLAWLRGHSTHAAVRSWAGYVALGGTATSR
jgi:CHAT domain-containing protein